MSDGEELVLPENYCDVGGQCTCCFWDRVQRGLIAKPRNRRPKFATAWLWRVIARQ